MYPSTFARRIFDDARLLICQNDLSPAFGVAAPPVMTLENQHSESLARRVGELLESIARKLLTALDLLVAAGEMPLREPECAERWTPESKVGRTVSAGFPRIWRSTTVLIERPARPLTREQAARVLGLHPRTLDRWARRGRLLTIDLGGTVRIPVAETLRLQPIAAPRRTA